MSNIPDNTSSVAIPDQLIDQVIGQENALEVVRLAAQQRRFLLIIGEPGTGKSLLGQSVAELLNNEGLEDLVSEENKEDPLAPSVKSHPAGQGEKIVAEAKQRSKHSIQSELYILWTIGIAAFIVSLYYTLRQENIFYLVGGIFTIAFLWFIRKKLLVRKNSATPKILVNNKNTSQAPFINGTGSQMGALLGDVRHDPYQSGGYETPPHQLLESGAIHRAHKGVLFIDEVATLSMESQQNLLTAIQEKEMPILGRSQGSSGTMVRSNSAPADFLLILAGNLEDLEGLHPALRSRIRGNGYEVYTKTTMKETPENTEKMVQFIAQEIKRDKKIPHFNKSAIEAILTEARIKSGKVVYFSTLFRELGGLIRIAGDLATQEKASLVEEAHVLSAKKFCVPLEQQIKERSA